jgi:PAS domain S-box-containing protein
MAPEHHRRDLADEPADDVPAVEPTLSQVATVTIDAVGTIRDFSPGAERLFGHLRADVLGQPLSDVLVPARLRGAHEAGLTRYRQYGHSPILGARLEMPALRADGQELTVELTITRTVAGDEELFTGVMRPVQQDRRVPGELRQSEQFHRTLVEQSPTVITVLNPDGTWRWSSKGSALGERPLGVQSSRIDEVIRQVAHPDDQDKVLDAIARALNHDCDGEPHEIRVDPVGGQWRSLSLRLLDLIDHPAVHGVVAYTTDVTRASRAERREEVGNARLSALIAALGVGVLMQDDRERVVLANTAFTRLFHLPHSPQYLYGRSIDELVSLIRAHGPAVRSAPVTSFAAERVVRGVVVSGEQFGAGDDRVVERDYVPIRLHGQTLGHLWVFRDVTDQVAARRALEARNRSLAELSALKTQFVSAISHELRTPLTSITMFAEMLRGERDLPVTDQVTAIDAVARNADRMLRLVEDLVLIGQLESGSSPLATEPVDVATLVTEAAARIRTGVEASGVRLEEATEAGPTITGDRERLRKALALMLEAAAAATGKGGSVRLHARHRAGSWVIEVVSLQPRAERALAAEGGVPAADAAVPSDAETTTGRGVSMTRGAAMAIMFGRTVATRHGGDLGAVRTPGGGVAFSLSLPVAPPAGTP